MDIDADTSQLYRRPRGPTRRRGVRAKTRLRPRLFPGRTNGHTIDRNWWCAVALLQHDAVESRRPDRRFRRNRDAAMDGDVESGVNAPIRCPLTASVAVTGTADRAVASGREPRR